MASSGASWRGASIFWRLGGDVERLEDSLALDPRELAGGLRWTALGSLGGAAKLGRVGSDTRWSLDIRVSIRITPDPGSSRHTGVGRGTHASRDSGGASRMQVPAPGLTAPEQPEETMAGNSFNARDQLTVDGLTYEVFRLDRVDGAARLPYSLKVLLENLLRNEDGLLVTAEQIGALGAWDPAAEGGSEIQFMPARVLIQDFTGVPCVVDLVAMRDAMADLGGDPRRINPLIPAELVIDHSVIADVFGRADAFRRNADLEFDRNQERYQLLRWAQQSFDEFLVVPPDTGICHQVNLEYLSRVVFTTNGPGVAAAYPDTLVGTDSHTPMVNGLGVLGWGVGGIEAEAAMLGQPMSMLIPQVVGVKLTGDLREGVT